MRDDRIDAIARSPGLRGLPSVDRLANGATGRALQQRHGRSLVSAEARSLIAERREALAAGRASARDVEFETLCEALAERVERAVRPGLVPVLNLTGTVLHTNLGRAVLPRSAASRVEAAMTSTTNLEYDLATGARGDREGAVEALLVRLTGAQAATVVNNNAAAVLLTVAALAGGRRVVLSRGELVEIGGSFRIPEVMASAGAQLVEVGTTNRTHPRDYEAAIDASTGIVMKVHTSNYVIQGFTASVDERTLAGVCRRRGVPLVSDLGSGALVDLGAWNLPREPMPREMLEAGCDVVTFSGDKLLGGPQAGMIVGSAACIERIRRHPMKRALRLSKMTLAALEATLQAYLHPERLTDELPTLRWLTRPVDEIERLALNLRPALAEVLGSGFRVETMPMRSEIGSGSLPGRGVPSFGLSIAVAAERRRQGAAALQGLARTLRGLPVPVIGRIASERLLLDLRCLDCAEDLAQVLPALGAALGRDGTGGPAAPAADGR
jgi:L-seryl-tRNA(Ser) seleniumtransferase